MQPGLSLYLDFIRIISALIVVIFHSTIRQMGGSWFKFPFGADALIVFFVMSGFVISYISEVKEQTPSEYFTARIARLWSILIPALLMTPIFDFFGRNIDPNVYEGWGHWLQFDNAFRNILISGLFLNEIWFYSITPLSNGPVWSLSYEFWFYVIFGVYFLNSGLKRLILTVCACLVAGPKILLLMPPWLMGVYAYKKQIFHRFSANIIWLIFILSIVLIIIGRISGIPEIFIRLVVNYTGYSFSFNYLKYSLSFGWFFIVGILVSTHILAAKELSTSIFNFLNRFSDIIRMSAKYTYGIYLMHHPAQLFMSAMCKDMNDGIFKTLIVILFSISTGVALQFIMEPVRPVLKNILYSTFVRRAVVDPG